MHGYSESDMWAAIGCVFDAERVDRRVLLSTCRMTTSVSAAAKALSVAGKKFNRSIQRAIDLLNGASDDVPIANKEFPQLGTVTLVDI